MNSEPVRCGGHFNPATAITVHWQSLFLLGKVMADCMRKKSIIILYRCECVWMSLLGGREGGREGERDSGERVKENEYH